LKLGDISAKPGISHSSIFRDMHGAERIDRLSSRGIWVKDPISGCIGGIEFDGRGIRESGAGRKFADDGMVLPHF
jgi:hypothetical protein